MSNEIPTRMRQAVVARDVERCLRCGLPGSQWHHRRRRNVKTHYQHCSCNGVLLCLTCHAWVHAHPEAARRDGFIVSQSVALPGEVPVVTYFGTILLNCEGNYEHERK